MPLVYSRQTGSKECLTSIPNKQQCIHDTRVQFSRLGWLEYSTHISIIDTPLTVRGVQIKKICIYINHLCRYDMGNQQHKACSQDRIVWWWNENHYFATHRLM